MADECMSVTEWRKGRRGLQKNGSGSLDSLAGIYSGGSNKAKAATDCSTQSVRDFCREKKIKIRHKSAEQRLLRPSRF